MRRNLGSLGGGVGGWGVITTQAVLTHAPQRDRDYCLHFIDEEMRLREVQWVSKVTKLGNCKTCCLQGTPAGT